jgi:hypothetical protein
MYYKDDSEKEFICSTEDSSGMHKCNALPLFVTEDGTECMASLETGYLFYTIHFVRWQFQNARTNYLIAKITFLSLVFIKILRNVV